jgi:hypothetical protein
MHGGANAVRRPNVEMEPSSRHPGDVHTRNTFAGAEEGDVALSSFPDEASRIVVRVEMTGLEARKWNM